MTSPPSYPIQIFYDGACRMCVNQMKKFQKKDAGQRLIFIDISRPDFEAKNFGLSGKPVQKYIYTKDADGRITKGIDALINIWKATNIYFLPVIISLPVIKQFAKLIYRIISHTRYILGGNKTTCDFHCAKDI